MRATAPFTLDAFDAQAPYDDADGIALARATLRKTFTGDLVGTSTVELQSARTPTGPSAYVALERITGTLGGRAGSFVLVHAGTMDGGEAWAVWPIAPGSGTGGLAGISGLGEILIEDGAHTLVLDYQLAQ